MRRDKVRIHSIHRSVQLAQRAAQDQARRQKHLVLSGAMGAGDWSSSARGAKESVAGRSMAVQSNSDGMAMGETRYRNQGLKASRKYRRFRVRGWT